VIARVALILLCAGLVALGEERWVEVRHGPFQVLSEAGEKQGREKLAWLEQFRYALGMTLGHDDLTTRWPVRLLVVRHGKHPVVAANSSSFALGRDAYLAAVSDNSAVPEALARDLARLLIEDNTQRLPERVGKGLEAAFSTLQVDGTHVSFGNPPAGSAKDSGWALMRTLAGDANTFGEVRVLVNNLEQGADWDTACRNAFQKSGTAMDQLAARQLQAGQFANDPLPYSPISPTRDFRVSTLPKQESQLALADWMLANGLPQAAQQYQDLPEPYRSEGLGLIAAKAGNREVAIKELSSTVAAQSESARVYYELGQLEKDTPKKQADWKHAVDLNPHWGAPFAALSKLEPNPISQAGWLAKAANAEPRNAGYWQLLAEAETAANQFPEARRAWSRAERAAANPAERQRLEQARLNVEKQQADYAESERRREAEERERHLEAVQNASMAEIHAAEQRAHDQLNKPGEGSVSNPVPWDQLDGNTKVSGLLDRVECRGSIARLVIRQNSGTVAALLVRNPAHLPVSGAGQTTLACGAQTARREVSVQYTARKDKRFGTMGDAEAVTFQ